MKSTGCHADIVVLIFLSLSFSLTHTFMLECPSASHYKKPKPVLSPEFIFLLEPLSSLQPNVRPRITCDPLLCASPHLTRHQEQARLWGETAQEPSLSVLGHCHPFSAVPVNFHLHLAPAAFLGFRLFHLSNSSLGTVRVQSGKVMGEYRLQSQ